MDSPTTTVPANETAMPSHSERGAASCSTQALSRAIRIGPTFTIRAAVPASTRRSPQLRKTM